MDKEKVPPIIGAVLLVVGIIIVFFVFIQALNMVTNVGDYFREQFPEEEGEEEAEGPTAAFSWNVNELEVNFADESERGDADIRHWEWNFGDGDTSNQQNPSHTYSYDGEFRVSLRVEDQNGETDTTYGDVRAEMGNFDGGRSEENFGDMNFEFGVGGILTPLAAAFLVAILFIVMFLVGAAMIKAGWNLVKPGPSTLKLKIKPKKLEVEQAAGEPAYAQASAPAGQPASPTPAHAYHSQHTPDAVIASMRALPANQPVQQTNYGQANPGYYNQQAYATQGPERPTPQTPSPPPIPSYQSQPAQSNQDNWQQTDQRNWSSQQSETAEPPRENTVQPTPQTPEPVNEPPQVEKIPVAEPTQSTVEAPSEPVPVKQPESRQNAPQAQQPPPSRGGQPPQNRGSGRPPARNNAKPRKNTQRKGKSKGKGKGKSKGKKGKSRKRK